MSDETGKSSVSGGLRALLIVSLAVNLLLIGTVVGWGIGHGKHPGKWDIRNEPPVHAFGNPKRVLRHLGKENHAEMDKILREDMKTLKPRLHKIYQLRREAFDTLNIKPFDADKANKAFAALAEAEAAVHRESSETMVKMLQVLPEEERNEVLQRMKEEAERRAKERRERRTERRDGPPPPPPGP